MKKDPIQQYQIENDAYLKKTFSGWIKQNFLITVKKRFLTNPLYFEKVVTKYHMLDMSLDRYIHHQNDLEFEICQFITMFHLHNTFRLSEAEIGKLQNDENYIAKLCSQVFNAVVVKDYSLSHLTSNSIFGYYPLAYYCGVMTNYMSDHLNQKIFSKEKIRTYNEKIFIPTFSKILTKSLAICVLINANLFEETLVFLRYIIESLAIFIAINDYPDAIEYHNTLALYRNERSINDEYPKAFLDDCKKYKIDPKNKNGFLNYGWLIMVPGENNKKRFTFDGVLDAIPSSTKELINLKKYLKKQYKMCGTFAHSTTIKHDSCSVMLNILQNTAYLLDITSEFFSKSLGTNYVIDGVDVKEIFRTFYFESQYSDHEYKTSGSAKKINNLFLQPRFIE